MKNVSQEEWKARVELAACYRIFEMLGWSEVIYSHITLRIPGPNNHFLINPFGLRYDEVRASNLVAIDLEGRPVGPNAEMAHGINPAGFVIHGAFHESMPEAHCVMHTHTTAGSAVACSKEGLVNCNFYSAHLYGEVAYHDFEGITLRTEERESLLRDMGTRHAMILRNHGLLTWGRDVVQAFAFMWTLQRACEIQLAARQLGEVIPIPEHIAKQASRETFQFDPKSNGAQMMFDALVRKVELRDPSFRW